MEKVKELWAKLTDTNQDSGMRGHEFTGGQAHLGAAHDPMTCPHCCDIRELMLAVLDEARDCVIPRLFTAEWDDEVLRTHIQELAL